MDHKMGCPHATGPSERPCICERRKGERRTTVTPMSKMVADRRVSDRRTGGDRQKGGDVSKITVERWIDEDEAEGRDESLGGVGGWFGRDQTHTWDDYLDAFDESEHPYILAMRDEVVRIGLREGGDWHQRGEGTPLFSDGTIASFSYRAWGDLLAAIWAGEDGLPYSYMSFYMSPGATAESIRKDMDARPMLYGTKEERAAFDAETIAEFAARITRPPEETT